MPTYEYACLKCGHHFEQFQPMTAEPLKKCPKCRKTGLKRLIGAGAGLIFKGSGFYITDYKKTTAPKEGGEAKPSGEAKSSEETKSSGAANRPSGGDAKPAAKEAKPPAKS